MCVETHSNLIGHPRVKAEFVGFPFDATSVSYAEKEVSFPMKTIRSPQHRCANLIEYGLTSNLIVAGA